MRATQHHASGSQTWTLSKPSSSKAERSETSNPLRCNSSTSRVRGGNTAATARNPTSFSIAAEAAGPSTLWQSSFIVSALTFMRESLTAPRLRRESIKCERTSILSIQAGARASGVHCAAPASTRRYRSNPLARRPVARRRSRDLGVRLFREEWCWRKSKTWIPQISYTLRSSSTGAHSSPCDWHS